MSKHDEKLEQKSPAKPVIKKGSGALDDKDLEKVNDGVTLNYEKIEVKRHFLEQPAYVALTESALKRITDSSRISIRVRKVPPPDAERNAPNVVL